MHSTGALRFVPLFLFLFLSLGTSAQQIWFAPEDNVQRGSTPPKNADFPHLFDSNPAWSLEADVFAISPAAANALPPEELQRINAFLQRHHIALAVNIHAAQMDNESPVPGECGFGVEGMNRPKRNGDVFRRLKALNLDISYVAMDEPLTFAHYYTKKNACQFSIQDTARRVAASIAEIRQYYPNVPIVDEEAPTTTSDRQWNSDFPVWLAAYQQATGSPLAAVLFDVDWKQPWLAWVVPSVDVAHKNNVKAGIFITGNGPGMSDADSISSRKTNALSVQQAHIPFDIVVIANWTPHPFNNLPESDPNTLTNFLHWYQGKRTQGH